MRQVRNSNVVLTAYYGFGDALSGGFGSTVARPGGLHGWYGLWPRDVEDQSSSYQELRNLVDAVDEEAKEIAQGTNGLSRGLFLEGVMVGRDMLSYVDLAKGAIKHQSKLVDYVQSWVRQALRREVKVLQVEEWFQEGHGILEGSKDLHGVWIPHHEPNGRVYLWNPPPVIADVALKECMKAIHKRTDAFHIFLIP